MFAICFQKRCVSYYFDARVYFNGVKHAFSREYSVFSSVQLMAEFNDIFFPVAFCLLVGTTITNWASK